MQKQQLAFALCTFHGFFVQRLPCDRACLKAANKGIRTFTSAVSQRRIGFRGLGGCRILSYAQRFQGRSGCCQLRENHVAGCWARPSIWRGSCRTMVSLSLRAEDLNVMEKSRISKGLRLFFQTQRAVARTFLSVQALAQVNDGTVGKPWNNWSLPAARCRSARLQLRAHRGAVGLYLCKGRDYVSMESCYPVQE